ncbi:MAG: hypothetical protein QF893_01635 [Alphaproteobacteria bacterium]|jgi:hemerythrin-like metal-binding protein|nr:hypothetical protein [Alphaproteobacteria bacterium]
MDWSAGFSEKFAYMDKEHEALAAKLQDVKTMPEGGEGGGPKFEALKFLRMLKEHVGNEEATMECYQYPERELHKKHHEILLESVECIIEFFDVAAMAVNRERIVNHIENRLSEELFVDSRLASFLRAQHEAM